MFFKSVLLSLVLVATTSASCVHDEPNQNEKFTQTIQTYLDSNFKSEVLELDYYVIDSIEVVNFTQKMIIQSEILEITKEVKGMVAQKDELKRKYQENPSKELENRFNQIVQEGKNKLELIESKTEEASVADSLNVVCYTVIAKVTGVLNNGKKNNGSIFFRISLDYKITKEPKEFHPEIFEVFTR